MKPLIVIILCAMIAYSANLLVNPGFESGLTGWQTTGDATFRALSDTVRTGTGAAAITVSSTPNYQRIYQEVSGLLPDNIYSASFYTRTLGVTTAPGSYIFVEFLDAGGGRISIVHGNQAYNSDTGWTYLHVDSAVAPSNAMKVRLGMVLHVNGTAYYDDASLNLLRKGDTLPAFVSADMNSVVQDDFLGINGVYHGFAFMPEEVNRGMNDADRAREFGRVAAMKLNIARTWYRSDWACSTKISDAFNWNSVKMQAFYSWLQAMKDRNVDVALNLGWWFAEDTYLGETDPNYAVDTVRFPQWISESLHEMIENRGFTNIKYGILFTEPTSYGAVPPGYASKWDYYVPLVKAIHNRLVADGRRNLIKLVGPNNTGGGGDIGRTASELNNEVDIFSGHDYGYADYEAWAGLMWNMQNAVKATGKKVWLDEYGKQDENYRKTPDYGNYVAQAVAASINYGIQTSTMWLLFDQLYVAPIEHGTSGDSFYDGVHRWGTCKWPHDATMTNPTEPYPHWYVFSMMSRLLPGRDSTKVFGTANSRGVILSAMRTKSGDVSFLLVNKNNIPKGFQLTLLPAPINKTFYKYVYDPSAIVPTEAATLIQHSATFANVRDTLNDTLPGRGVVIYSTINTGNGTGLYGDSISGAKEEAAVSCVPNPFNPLTTFRYSLQGKGTGSLSVFSVNGKLVRTFALTARTGSIVWDGKDASGRTMASGLYIARMALPGKVLQTRLTYLK